MIKTIFELSSENPLMFPRPVLNSNAMCDLMIMNAFKPKLYTQNLISKINDCGGKKSKNTQKNEGSKGTKEK